MTQELLQSVTDILDNAHSHCTQLTELLASLKEAKNQISESAELSRKAVKNHFNSIREVIEKAITERLGILLKNIDKVEENALSPLLECEDIVNDGLKKATNVLNEGKTMLCNKPGENVEKFLKFKDHPDTKHLESIPEIPDLSDVPFISMEFADDVGAKMSDMISALGKVRERAPVQISEIVERPGGLYVSWGEIDDELDFGEFNLQFSLGNIKSNTDSRATFHNAYTGPGTHHTVKHLKQNTMYSFRVRGRVDPKSVWHDWTVPRPAVTSIPHYQWCTHTQGYSSTSECKIGTRMSEGVTTVMYSKTCCYMAGLPITFKVLDSGEKTPFDGIGLAVDPDDVDTLQRKNAVFLATSGAVYVNGQEMTTKLPTVSKKSKINIETEVLGSEKIRVSMEVDGKVITFDWKIDQTQNIERSMSDDPSVYLYFGMRFSHEDWAIAVE